jgi:hypothetical protein
MLILMKILVEEPTTDGTMLNQTEVQITLTAEVSIQSSSRRATKKGVCWQGDQVSWCYSITPEWKVQDCSN